MRNAEQKNIMEIFLHNKNEAQEYLSQYGTTGQDRNIGVSLSYEQIYKNDPLFVWFSAATLGSIQVGKAISLVNYIPLNHFDSINTISLGFSYGNQEIHNNIVALYNTYQDYGVEGLRKLQELDETEKYISEEAVKAFEIYSEIKAQANQYAKSFNFSSNHIEVVKYILNQHENIILLKKASTLLVQHEQTIVQPMYELLFYENGLTVGETLNDVSFVQKLIANKIEWAGAKILDNYISTDGYDFSSYEQRMSYFSKVFDEYFKILTQEEGYERINEQRESMIADLEVKYIAYGEHFQEQNNYVQAGNIYLENIELSDTNQDPSIKVTNENSVQNILSTIIAGENEIVKISLDPLDVFLKINPNYEVIAHDISELWASTNYHRTPLYGGTALWNPNISYLSNSTYLALYDDGEYHYHQPNGEVRGITFPFLYDKSTGVPLTMRILDAAGHYDHISTIDTIYNNPQAFNSPSHINWYNPYWNQVVYQAKVDAVNSYFKSITIDSFMNSVLAPSIKSVNYNNSNLQLELKLNDVLYGDTGNIDFSNLKGTNSSSTGYLSAIGSEFMKLADGTTIFQDSSGGSYACINCHGDIVGVLEAAVNAVAHSF